MKLTNERLPSPRSVITEEQFDRIKYYITIWKDTHGKCNKFCAYCKDFGAPINQNIDVFIYNHQVKLNITVRRKGYFGIYYKHHETIYQEDDGPWWSDFWIDLNKSEEDILEKIKKTTEEYQQKLFQFSTEYIHNKYER